jgi:hypothetical protein
VERKGLFVRIRFVVLEGDARVGKRLVILHNWIRLCTSLQRNIKGLGVELLFSMLTKFLTAATLGRAREISKSEPMLHGMKQHYSLPQPSV